MPVSLLVVADMALLLASEADDVELLRGVDRVGRAEVHEGGSEQSAEPHARAPVRDPDGQGKALPLEVVKGFGINSFCQSRPNSRHDCRGPLEEPWALPEHWARQEYIGNLVEPQEVHKRRCSLVHDLIVPSRQSFFLQGCWLRQTD